MAVTTLRGVARKVDNEGFHYAFVNYSAFEEVKDAEFHRLRLAYLAAAAALSEYVGCDDEDDDDEK